MDAHSLSQTIEQLQCLKGIDSPLLQANNFTKTIEYAEQFQQALRQQLFELSCCAEGLRMMIELLNQDDSKAVTGLRCLLLPLQEKIMHISDTCNEII